MVHDFEKTWGSYRNSTSSYVDEAKIGTIRMKIEEQNVRINHIFVKDFLILSIFPLTLVMYN